MILLALSLKWVSGGSVQECGDFFGPKHDGTFFCKNSGGVAYNCPKSKVQDQFTVVMEGCVPYFDIYDFTLGPAAAAPSEQRCDAYKIYYRKQASFTHCAVLTTGAGETTKEAYRCKPPKAVPISMKDCEIIPDAQPTFGIEFYLDD
ncbi:hypothetical protein CROQUDRAFT_92068 [Cronartium quercuum f. sp. fusiforme G11]|uniref:Uncharacterized protein n=1 Tax=Cronartium quercuum f. sp. fusiforme G11 TaxID=708437 RepID=A0A9P6NH83_9BASI|nr:hypothetical protein CROQUDRAFT_92068 [Cronartium quercuum f. sp. fusiforme G11]